MNYCFADRGCNLHDTVVLEEYTSYDNCKIEIRKCKKCNGFWKIKYRDKGNIYLRVEEMNSDFPCTFFSYTEVKKYGFSIPCKSDLKIFEYRGLTCDPDNLETIKIIEKSKAIGFESEIAIRVCKTCKQIWKMYYHFDSHHGGFTVCLKPGESFNYNETGSFTNEEALTYADLT